MQKNESSSYYHYRKKLTNQNEKIEESSDTTEFDWLLKCSAKWPIKTEILKKGFISYIR